MGDTDNTRSGENAKLIIVMVGLPARGKSYVTKKLCRYLNWLQYDTKIFNVGDRRRRLGHSSTAQSNGEVLAPSLNEPPAHSANFFDPDNPEGNLLREQAATETLDELLHYLLSNGGRVAIFDATNSTIERRKFLIQRIRSAAPQLPVMFLESQCHDTELLQSNMRLKLSGPDFKNQDPVLALEDFKNRISMYEKKYVPLGRWEERCGYPYCQMIDVGRKFVLFNISGGYLATQVVHYLQHFNLLPRQIWLTRHGESDDDVAGRIGGDSELTPSGLKYAAALARFMELQKRKWEMSVTGRLEGRNQGSSDHLHRADVVEYDLKTFNIWTSQMRRSIQTAQFFTGARYQKQHLRMLNELNAGVLEGLTHEKIKDFYSNWYYERQKDKFLFPYPGVAGEGYLDVTNRLKSVILEVESATDDVLMISGLAVTRILLAYFQGYHRNDIVDLHIPLEELHMLEPKPYGVEHHVYSYNRETDEFEFVR